MVWSWSLHFTLSLACATGIWFCLIGRRSMQISLLFLASAKIKGAFQLRAIKEWKIIQCLDWCWNLQLHKLKPHVVFGGATNTFPHLESTMCCQKPWDLLCTRPGHTLQANAQSVHWIGPVYSKIPDTPYSFVQLGDLRRKSQLYWYQCKLHC